MSATSPPAEPTPLDDAEIDELQALLDSVPAPLQPLDISALDGLLAGVVLQRPAPPAAEWLPLLTDVDGRALPSQFDATRLHALALRRFSEIDAAVARRRWFDPWVFEFDEEEADAGDEAVESDDADRPAAVDAPSRPLIGWVAGFAAAMHHFPALLDRGGAATIEPLALLYRHLDADDLEDADELLAEIDALEPPVDLAEAVEDTVRAVFLLADVSRPVGPAPTPRRPVVGSGGKGRRPR